MSLRPTPSSSRRNNTRRTNKSRTKRRSCRADPDIYKKSTIMVLKSMMSSMKLLVLCLLCMQNTMFTVLRRYSQGVLKENYSKVSNHYCAYLVCVRILICKNGTG